MTRDDIIRMAREYLYTQFGWQEFHRYEFDEDELLHFAALLIAAEREACADLCEKTTAMWAETHFNDGCTGCAEAIRARGGSKPQGGGR